MLQFIIYLIIIFISIIDIIVLRLLPDHRDSIGTLLKKKKQKFASVTNRYIKNI